MTTRREPRQGSEVRKGLGVRYHQYGSLGSRLEREGETLRITSDRGAQVLIEVLRSLDAQGLEPDRLTVREPSIDDVFLTLLNQPLVPPQTDLRAAERQKAAAAGR